jgi:hypothetical protein
MGNGNRIRHNDERQWRTSDEMTKNMGVRVDISTRADAAKHAASGTEGSGSSPWGKGLRARADGCTLQHGGKDMHGSGADAR